MNGTKKIVVLAATFDEAVERQDHVFEAIERLTFYGNTTGISAHVDSRYEPLGYLHGVPVYHFPYQPPDQVYVVWATLTSLGVLD